MPPPEGALRARLGGRAGERRARPRAGAADEPRSTRDWAAGLSPHFRFRSRFSRSRSSEAGSPPNRDEPPADPQECVT